MPVVTDCRCCRPEEPAAYVVIRVIDEDGRLGSYVILQNMSDGMQRQYNRTTALL